MRKERSIEGGGEGVLIAEITGWCSQRNKSQHGLARSASIVGDGAGGNRLFASKASEKETVPFVAQAED
jgi:hypothetical protein